MSAEDPVFNWEVFLKKVEACIDDPLVYESWISSLSFVSANDKILVIGAPSQFIKNWVLSNFQDIFLEVCKGLIYPINTIELVVIGRAFNSFEGASVEVVPEVQDPIEASSFGGRLNPEYTFDNFVVGQPNIFAYNAALKVAQTEEILFNPLFIYGSVGLGKTHLLQSIAWYIHQHSARSFLYLTAEKFMNLYIIALRDNNMINFKEMFRSKDVLMVDDFQFIGGKGNTQEEFFHTFNTLISQGKQIILSADKSPLELDRIEERILSRLQAGLATNISDTTYELRISILETKIKQLQVSIPVSVLEFLAHSITSSVRELEGALKRIVHYHKLMGLKIDIDMAMHVMEDILRYSNKVISIEFIQKKIAEHYELRFTDISSSRKDKRTVWGRHIAMYICKQMTKLSLLEIGRKFGGRDHTTVLYSVRKIEKLIQKDFNLDKEVKSLISSIQRSA